MLQFYFFSICFCLVNLDDEMQILANKNLEKVLAEIEKFVSKSFRKLKL